MRKSRASQTGRKTAKASQDDESEQRRYERAADLDDPTGKLLKVRFGDADVGQEEVGVCRQRDGGSGDDEQS